MMLQRGLLAGGLAAYCLLGLLRGAWCEEAQDSYAVQITRATSAFDRADYSTAAMDYTLLLKQFPHSPEHERMLSDFAWCSLKLNRADDALATLQLLATDYPDSPYGGDALATLYQYTLSLADTQKSDAVWTLACTQWADTPFVWAVVREHYKYLAQQPHPTPEQLTEKLPQLYALPGFAENVGQAVYQPLIQGKHIPDAFTVFDTVLRRLDTADPSTALTLTTALYQPLVDERATDDARKAHDLVQALLKGNIPTLAVREQAAFDQFAAKNAELAFALFKLSLEQGDLRTANQWMNKLNMFDWQQPRAIEARRLLEEKNATRP